MTLVKNFLLLLLLAVLAYQASTLAQTKPDASSIFLFLTENTPSNSTNLNRIDISRSTLFSNDLIPAKVKPDSMHWTNLTSYKLLTFSTQEANSIKLYASLISASRPYTTKTIQLDQNIQNEYKISRWIARTATTFIAASNENKSIYVLTYIPGNNVPKVSLLYKASVPPTKKFASFSLDYANKNLLFSFAENKNAPLSFDKTFFIFRLDNQKLIKIDTSSTCRGNVSALKDQPLKLSSNTFVLFCGDEIGHKASFLVLDSVKGASVSYETSATLNSTSNFAIDTSGFFVLISKASERNVYCNGNFKEPLSFRCTNITLFPSGTVVSSSNLAQFYIINSRAVFALEFPTGQTKRTPILFSAPLDSDVLGPISL